MIQPTVSLGILVGGGNRSVARGGVCRRLCDGICDFSSGVSLLTWVPECDLCGCG